MQKFTRSLFAVGAVLGLAACGDDVSVTPPTPPLPAGIASVTVAPAQITIAIQEKVILTASVATTQGTGTPVTTVAWSSANAAIASVSAAGEVTGVAAGTTTIRATSTADAGKVGAAAVTVRALQVQSVVVTPQSLSLQVGQTATAVATVNRDAGASGAVTWTSSAAGVATVNNTTGLITAVSTGTAVITATSTADASKSAALAVTVVAVPNNLTALSVAPTSANLGVGGSVQLVPSATTVGTPAVTYTYATSNAAVATVSASGLVTAVGNGTAIITTTATTSTNTLSVSTTINVASASVSISSITAGGLGTPVNISNVAGQIEVTMNISAGNQTLDSVRVKLGNVSAATQAFTVNGAPNAPVSLSINTAAYTVNADSTATVSFLNGQTPVQAELFVSSATGPTASNTITINLNNLDTFHARWNMSSQTNALSSGGFIWYGGPTFNVTMNAVPVMYSGNTIASATLHLDDASVAGNASLCGAAVVDATAPFTASFACTGITNTTVQPGVAASLRGDGNAGPAGVDATGNSTVRFANGAMLVQASAVPVRVDVAGPATATYAFVAGTPNDYWASASFRHDSSLTNVLARARGADAGVGSAAASTDVYQYEDRAVTDTIWMNHAANTTNIPENAIDFTVNAYNGRVIERDLLGNVTVTYLGSTQSTPGTQNFGVDVTAPTLSYLTDVQQPLIVLPAADTLQATRILNNADPVTANNITAVNAHFGVRYRDTRSGFNTNVGAEPQFVRILRLAPGGVQCALGGTNCAYTRILGAVDLTDNTYRRDTTQIYGTYGAALAAATAADSSGYYTYETYVTDRAGNITPVITKTVAVDILAPQVTGVGIPASLIGGSTIAFTPTGTDDLEIIDGALSMKYPNMGGVALGDSTIYFPRSFFADIKSPFSGAPLSNVIGLSGQFGANGLTLPIGFIRSISVVDADTTAPALPTTQLGRDAAKPVQVGSQLFDIKAVSLLPAPIGNSAVDADSSATLFVNILSGLVASPTTNTFATALGDSTTAIWHIFGAGTTGSSIQARARTSTVITNAPFPQVAYFRVDAAGRWVYLGKVDAVPGTNPTIFDQGANRFWTYTLSGVTPAVAANDIIRAIGVNSSGDGLSTLTCVKGAGC